ncbi:MAG: transcription antitermination factor NusB [Alphaproteobacteria bacterium]|nr:MAG: transcription antitermination factor NusB [Alphaproteobacteria bacterium]
MTACAPDSKDKGRLPRARSAARLAAVQALFQWDRSGDRPEQIVRQFIHQRLGEEIDGFKPAPADEAFFSDIVAGVAARRDDLDARIAAHLAENWTLARIDPLLLAILRAGTYELVARPDVPTATVINEYLDVVHAFYEGVEAKFVNAVLDRIARAAARA